MDNSSSSLEKGFTVHQQRNSYYIDLTDFLDMRGKKSADRANQDYEQTMEVEDTLNENYGSDSQQRNDTDSDDRTMDVNNNQQGGETTSPGKSKMSFTNPLFWKMAIKSLTTCGAKQIEDQGHVLPDYEKNNPMFTELVENIGGQKHEHRQWFATSLFWSMCTVEDIYQKNMNGRVFCSRGREGKAKVNPEKFKDI